MSADVERLSRLVLRWEAAGREVWELERRARLGAISRRPDVVAAGDRAEALLPGARLEWTGISRQILAMFGRDGARRPIVNARGVVREIRRQAEGAK